MRRRLLSFRDGRHAVSHDEPVPLKGSFVPGGQRVFLAERSVPLRLSLSDAENALNRAGEPSFVHGLERRSERDIGAGGANLWM
jgi:hypothetical protein